MHISVINTITYTPVLFVWTKLRDVEMRDRSHRYCVYFHAQAGPPFTSMVAAHLLLRFPQRWRGRTATRFNVRQISWAIDDRGAWGVLAFSTDFAAAFAAAQEWASASKQIGCAPDHQTHITTWPESKDNRHMQSVSMIDKVVSAGRYNQSQAFEFTNI